MKLLADFALPIISSTFDSNWVFQQDNTPPHRSQTTQLFLETRGIDNLGWPSRSHDLIVIENNRHFLCERVYGDETVQNVQIFKAKIREAVRGLNNEVNIGRNIFTSFSKRILKCLELAGNLVS